MKIYTGFGDKGKTRLYGGEVVNKDHPRIEIYGTLDELNSWLGLVIVSESEQAVKNILTKVQNHIFNISSLIATPDEENRNQLKAKLNNIEYHFIEEFIDEINAKLTPLQNFILPGGSELSSYYQISRTVCRRAERKIIKQFELNEIENEILIYLNRLSDLLFVLARYANKNKSVDDIIWSSQK
jgi:cob(I)alamin adenosyltransferase